MLRFLLLFFCDCFFALLKVRTYVVSFVSFPEFVLLWFTFHPKRWFSMFKCNGDAVLTVVLGTSIQF